MAPPRPTSILAPLAALAVAACAAGGDGAADERPELAFPDYGVPDPGNGDGRSDPGTAPGTHPFVPGLSWDAFWPGEDGSATYRLRTPRTEVVTVDTSVKDGPQWPLGTGGSLFRVAFGLPPRYAGESDALVVYLDRKTPWLLKVRGVEVYEKGHVDGPADVMAFDPPLEIPLDAPAGQYATREASVRSDPADPVTARAATFRLGVQSYDTGCGPSFPELSGCVRYHAEAWGPLVGFGEGDPLVSDVLFHPLRRLLFWNGAPGFVWIEQVDPWPDGGS